MKKGLISLMMSLLPLFTFAQENELGIDQRIDQAFKPFSDFISSIVFFEVFDGAPFVIILLVLSALFFTLYFGFPNIKYFGKAINVVRGKYDHVDESSSGNSDLAIDGDIKDTIADESKDGEVTHFQALATAVSGTVGNGNIAGVALAIALGGPGATFWMIVCGLLGMSTKFVECTLGVQYRDVGEDGTVYGGPMYYLSKGLKEKGFGVLGKITAVLFAIFCIGGSFGGGNAAQSNQATIVLKELLGWDSSSAGAIIGIVLAVLVGIIIIGGIKRIASVTEKVVPFMAVLYLLACIYIIVTNFSLVDNAFGLIISEAFNPQAIGVGGIIGVLLVGFKRAAFSNEAGAGSASIAHSAVKTKYSASEGLVALLEPFIDTVVICTMTALVIIIFNFNGDVNNDKQFTYGKIKVQSVVNYNSEEVVSENGVFNIGDKKYEQDDLGNIYIDNETVVVNTLALIDGKKYFKTNNKFRIPYVEKDSLGNDVTIIGEYDNVKGKVMIDGKLYEGAGITSKAFAEYIPYSNVFLTIAVVLFAVSTMISWSYYGLQSWKFLFGRGKLADITYKLLFLAFVVIGAAASMNSIWGFSDAMIFAMVFPNMVGLFFLFPVVKKQLTRYLEAIKK
ncbi:MAG: alanine/glycine:cation symporter family protein [Flavobacteriales bacterium]|jgi:alanine or glycine:cation symporter, AGCS family|nr:alanine/glycine:cation symporter family protein [Flavobacteriales bacterium]